MIKSTILIFVILIFSCGNQKTDTQDKLAEITSKTEFTSAYSKPIVAANRIAEYLPLLSNKKIGVVANQTSVIFSNKGFTHLVDSLVSLDVNIQKVFAPEHGIRGTADAGELVKDGIDTTTGIPIISLYGKNKKPSETQLTNLDIVIFDIQDVGARFYTYISTLHYVMEACAELNIPLMILDRPNPNGHYVDGPILKLENQSFVGMHPIPIVHGLTIGEYAQMINGERWLDHQVQCNITVIKMANYNRAIIYDLPIKPSPNFTNAKSINLYPSLCFFEGTNVNAGRGTDKQFQIFGSPYLNKEKYKFTYTPVSNEGAKYPKHNNKLCYGLNLNDSETLNHIKLEWLIDAYNNTEDKASFFNDFFVKLSGDDTLEKQIKKGLSANEITKSWQTDLDKFKEMSSQYMLYN